MKLTFHLTLTGFLLFLSLPVFSQASAGIVISSYTSLQMMSDRQKDFYAEKMRPVLRAIPALHDLSKTEIRNAMDDRDEWNRIKARFTEACLAPKHYGQVCKRAAQIRDEMIEMAGPLRGETPISEDSRPAAPRKTKISSPEGGTK